MALFNRKGSNRQGRDDRADRTGTPADLLIVGLGNPGTKYEGTRHNVGVDVIEVLASRHGGRLRKGRELALADEVRVGQHRIALAFPQTFMNESGQSVRPLVRRYGVEDLSRLVIVHDELDLPVGRFKIKLGGGLAGHNGLKSIKAHLHTADFTRIRIGVGRPQGQGSGADYVLRRPGKQEAAELGEVVETAADSIEFMADHGLDRAMAEHNRADR